LLFVVVVVVGVVAVVASTNTLDGIVAVVDGIKIYNFPALTLFSAAKSVDMSFRTFLRLGLHDFAFFSLGFLSILLLLLLCLFGIILRFSSKRRLSQKLGLYQLLVACLLARLALDCLNWVTKVVI